MKHANDIRREAVERVQVLRRDPTFQQKLKTFLKIFLPLAFIVVAAGIVVILILTRPESTPKPATEREWTVAVVPAKAVDVQPERRFFGRVVAGREVELRAEVAGKVVEVGPSFVDGGVVRAGDLLVRIDPFDYEAALKETEADLKGARGLLERDREQIKLLRRDVARRVRLKGRGAGSTKALDDSRLRLSEAEQRIIDRTNRIERLEVGLARARRSLDNSRILAPFDGFIVGASTAVGKYLRQGDSLGKAINAKRLEVRFLVSNAEFDSFLSNDRYKKRNADVRWSGKRFAARLDRVESEVRAASGGVDMFARLEGVDAVSSLRPGAFVEISVPGPQFEGVIRIPEVALYGGETVYRVVEGRLDAVRVEVAGRDGKDLFIRGAFAPDDRIVTTRFPEAGSGIKVRVP